MAAARFGDTALMGFVDAESGEQSSRDAETAARKLLAADLQLLFLQKTLRAWADGVPGALGARNTAVLRRAFAQAPTAPMLQQLRALGRGRLLQLRRHWAPHLARVLRAVFRMTPEDFDTAVLFDGRPRAREQTPFERVLYQQRGLAGAEAIALRVGREFPELSREVAALLEQEEADGAPRLEQARAGRERGRRAPWRAPL